MKNIILILVFGILMIGCKKNKEEPDTVLIVIVKKSDGSLAQVVSTSVSGCYNPDGQNGCQLASGSTVNGFTEMDGRFTINNARTDVYYEVDASDGTEGVTYYHPSKLTPHTTNYITVTMQP